MTPVQDFLRKSVRCALFLVMILSPEIADAKDNLKIAYTFSGGSDGALPYGGMIADSSGTFYGTTYSGGGTGCGGQGCGTVFRLNPDGTESVLYAFTGTDGDGGFPTAALVMDDNGNLYGTTNNFGIAGCHSYGCGTVFRVDQAGHETVLYAFHGGSDGGNPYSGLILDKKGNLNGTTMGGGTGTGVVFKLAQDGTETILHAFSGYDGAFPAGGLIADKNGNLYGTASEGGDCIWTDFEGCGTVFRISPSGKFKVLHIFSGYPDGAVPYAGLTFDKNGSLYGTTIFGGDSSCWDLGCGTIFRIKPNGTVSVFHSFCQTGSTLCAFQPRSEVLFDSKGNIYGTTYAGGNDGCYEQSGCGLVFKLSPDGTENVLHVFDAFPDGWNPLGTLIKGGNGILYGVTQSGGRSVDGTVFTLKK